MTYLLKTIRPEGLEKLEQAAGKLYSLAGLIGQADDLDVAGRDGLGMLFTDIAQDIADAIVDVQAELAKLRLDSARGHQ